MTAEIKERGYAELVAALRTHGNQYFPAEEAAAAIERLVTERDSLELALKDEVKAHLDAEARAEKAEALMEKYRTMWAEGTNDRERLLARAEKAEAERDQARIWHEKAHTFLEQKRDAEARAEKAEARLASIPTCDDLIEALIRAEKAEAALKEIASKAKSAAAYWNGPEQPSFHKLEDIAFAALKEQGK